MPIALLKTLTGAWEQVRGYLHDDLERIEMELNLPVDAEDIVGTLPINVLPNVPPGTLLGRGSNSGSGPAEEIDIGAGLIMDGTMLRVNAGSLGIRQAEQGHQQSGEGSQGRRGPIGPQGLVGPMGPRGMRGQDGDRGPAGPAGVSAGGGPFNPDILYWTLLANGDTIEPELVFDGTGDVIWVPVP